jgi:L-ribulokinase
MSLVLGVDFGTASVRSIVVDSRTGSILGSGEYAYRYAPACSNPFMVRHHLDDYRLGLEQSIREAIKEVDAALITGLGIGSTGSSILPVLEDGTALLDLPAHQNNPNAHIWLWKDHTPTEEAVTINSLIHRSYPHYLKRIGSIYSAEWYWSKVLHCLHVDPDLFGEAYTWIEITDYLLFLLSEKTHIDEATRNICAASHKALYDGEAGGYPPLSFLEDLDERLIPLGRSLHRSDVQPCDRQSGRLNSEWAKRLGLQEGITLATGALDAHFGALGAGVGVGTLVKIVGTSSCDLTVVPLDNPLSDSKGLSGVVQHSVLPGMWGVEAGQSGVGDIFGWYVDSFLGGSHQTLMEEAAALRPGQSGLLSLDWHNGNRSILQDQNLTGLILGLDLSTTPAEVYRALIEATAFGSKMILDRLEECDMHLKRIVLAGGIPQKNPLLVQIYADVHERPIHVAENEYASALGSAIASSVACGIHPSIEEAQEAIVPKPTHVIHPNEKATVIYRRLHSIYRSLHDSFGVADTAFNLHPVMKELLSLKNEG